MNDFRATVLAGLCLLFLASLPVSAAAQNIYIYPTEAVAPRGSYQTVTAIVDGVNNKTVTWSTDKGTLVGTNPCVVNEPCTIAVYDTNVETATLTATSNADGSVVATSSLTFAASPTPVSTHPRFLITQAMLPALRAKAVSGNVPYQAILSTALRLYADDTNNAHWSWTCNGGTGQPSSDQIQNAREYDAWFFSLMALIDPSDPTYKWSCYAHDVGLYMMSNYEAEGFPSGNNQWSDQSWIFSTLGDWMLGSSAITTDTDKASLRQFYTFLSKMMFQQGNFTVPAGTFGGVTYSYNSPSMFHGYAYNGSAVPSGSGDYNTMRGISGNNYNESRMLMMAAIGLTFDDNTTDAPNIPAGSGNTCGATRYEVCIDGTAGSLRAYWNYETGAALYDFWAHIEDPNVSWQAYQSSYGNLPTQPQCEDSDYQMQPCFGDSRDGASAEGNFYKYSFFRMRWLFNLLHTAGMDDPLIYGPQMSASTSSWWDMKVLNDYELLTGPTHENYSNPGGAIYPTYSFLTVGELNWYNIFPSGVSSEAALLNFDSLTGRTDRANTLKWINYNLAFGGPAGNLYGCTSDCGYDNNLGNLAWGGTTFLDMFIALPAGDPVAGTLPADPRPSMPLDYYDGSLNQNAVIRTNWGMTNSSEVAYWFNNSQNNHEFNEDGRFDIFSCLSGTCEYITKGRAGWTDYIYYIDASNSGQNVLGIQNSTGTSNGQFESQMYLNGGQFSEGGQQNNAIAVAHSELPTYAAAHSDITGAYNGAANYYVYAAYNDVLSASRSFIFIKEANQFVYYDRAAVGHAASTQVLNQVTTGPPTISGSVASWGTRSGTQKAIMTSLLPAGATIVDHGLPCQTCGSNPPEGQDWEVYTDLQITPAGTPKSVNYLTALEWGGSGLTSASPTVVQSSAGTAFDGAHIGSSLVMFMRTWPAAASSTTFPASGATTIYVSDLTPNTTYVVSGAGTPTSATTDTAGVLTFSASGTGNITVSTGSTPTLQSITVTPSSTSLQTLATQQYAAACTYSDGTSVDCTSQVAWSSSAMGVATVSAIGITTGVAQGSANIIATSGSVQGQAAVTVPAPILQSIAVAPGSLTVAAGGSQQFTATGVYSDSRVVDMTSTVSWSSSNAAVVAPNATGLTAAMSQGSAVITASSGSVKGQAAVVVTPPAAPIFSPPSGSYTSVQTVAISTTTPSATIHYTTDGSTPTSSSAVYSGPLTVSSTSTVQAIAMSGGSSASTVSSATYTINLPAAAAPMFSPAPGTYTSAQVVTIGTTTASSTIHYTMDGSTPTIGSAAYTSPITVSATETLRAIAVATGDSASPVSSAVYTIIPVTASPTFSPAPGTYTTTQSVVIGAMTASSTIHYTLDGSTPTISSAVYIGPITVSATETLKAIAVATGDSASPVSSAAYTIIPVTGSPTFSPAPGTYTTTQNIVIGATTASSTIHYTVDGSTPTISSAVYIGPITVSATETLKAIAVATGDSASPVISAAYTITPVTASPTFNPAPGTYTTTQKVTISTSTPSSTIYYAVNGTYALYSGPITVAASETLSAIATAPGNTASPVASAAYTISLVAASPTFSPAAGAYSSNQIVTIGSTTHGVTIYFTTNGSAPSTSSSVYSGPIMVSATETVRAIAIAAGGSASPVSSADYTITPVTASPTFLPEPGTYASEQLVTIKSTTPSAMIFYSVNGVYAPYIRPIMVSATQTIKAIAVAPDHLSSPISSAAYTISPAAATPNFSPAPGTYTSAQKVHLSTATPTATIHYTTDGSAPSSGSAVYTAPIDVSATQTIRSIAIANGYRSSDVGAASYTVVHPKAVAPVINPAGGTYFSPQKVTLTTSTPSASIHYTLDGSRPTSASAVYAGPITVAATETIKAIAVATGDSPSPVSEVGYIIIQSAGVPAFSPAPGTYSEAQTVTISTATHAATIHYTIDGSTPTVHSPAYFGPIRVTASTTLKAIAVVTGSSSPSQSSVLTSSVGEAIYSLNSKTSKVATAIFPTPPNPSPWDPARTSVVLRSELKPTSSHDFPGLHARMPYLPTGAASAATVALTSSALIPASTPYAALRGLKSDPLRSSGNIPVSSSGHDQTLVARACFT